MKKKSTEPVKKAARDPNAVLIEGKEPADAKEKALLIARTVLRPSVQAAATIKEFNKTADNIEIMGLVDALVEQVGHANANDLKRAEAILIAQAHTLDALFNTLARRSALNMGEYTSAAETYLRLALKAQSQCRATLETLATIKNPQAVAFVKQANIAAGPQQVNNGTMAQDAVRDPSRAGKTENSQSKLLEQDGKRLDIGTKIPTGNVDSQLATVGALNRTENTAR